MHATGPVQGVGLGLRSGMAEALFAANPSEVRWLEIHPENYVQRGGRFRHMLERARERWPIVTHGLTLGFGATTAAESSYTTPLRALLREIGTPFHSEHLCFSSSEGVMLHDLMPLPLRRESIENATARIRELRDTLELPIAIENVSYYAHPGRAHMTEVDFVLEVLEGADAKLLLDVNNVFVNAKNHGFDPYEYLDRIPPERVVQVHVAGHYTRKDGVIIDTHGQAVREEVFDLLEHALRRIGPVPVLLERDQNFPPLSQLLEELRRIDMIYRRATAPCDPVQAGA